MLPSPLQPASLDFPPGPEWPSALPEHAARAASSLPVLPRLCAAIDEQIKMSSSFKSGTRWADRGRIEEGAGLGESEFYRSAFGW